MRWLAVLLLGSMSLLASTGLPSATPVGARAAVGWAPPLPEPLLVVRRFEVTAPYGPGHRGVDLAAAPGTPVRSPGPGTVRFAGPVGGHGVVSVDVGGLRFTYEPVIPALHTGATVRTGSVLGRLVPGHPGCRAPAGAACLHWGVRNGARYLDPLRPVVVRVRLLPLHEPAPP